MTRVTNNVAQSSSSSLARRPRKTGARATESLALCDRLTWRMIVVRVRPSGSRSIIRLSLTPGGTVVAARGSDASEVSTLSTGTYFRFFDTLPPYAMPLAGSDTLLLCSRGSEAVERSALTERRPADDGATGTSDSARARGGAVGCDNSTTIGRLAAVESVVPGECRVAELSTVGLLRWTRAVSGTDAAVADVGTLSTFGAVPVLPDGKGDALKLRASDSALVDGPVAIAGRVAAGASGTGAAVRCGGIAATSCGTPVIGDGGIGGVGPAGLLFAAGGGSAWTIAPSDPGVVAAWALVDAWDGTASPGTASAVGIAFSRANRSRFCV